LIVEAGTGTGKSLAYLIPSVLYAHRNDTRVVVSTHTVALQDQIRDRDFPTLRMVLGDEISLAVFKGRNHYVCMRKLEQEAGAIGFGSPADETIAVMAYLRWLVDTREGMREELSMRGAMNTVWARVQSESETCIGKRCPFFKPCFYFRARARAHEADVVVTNHSLVFADLRADHRILPRYNKLVFDEAHHLEEQATQHLGEEIQFARCITVLTRLVRDNRQHGLLPELSQRLTGTHVSAKVLPILDRVAARVTGLRPMLDAVFGTVAALIPPGETVQRFDEACTRRREWSTFISAVHEVTDYMGPLADDYDELLHLADEMEGDLDVTGGRLLDACGLLRELIEQVAVLQRATVHDDMWVVWAEKGGSDARSVSVRRAPLDVAHLLKERLFANKQSVILTSATLSVNGNFSFVQRQLGLEDGADKRVATLMVESPFDIAGQALLCIPSDVPDLAGIPIEDASRWLTASLERLAAVSQGRMLVLFTSHALLRAVAQRIREPLRRLGLRLYAQGVDGNRSKILDAFRSEPASVLFGAQSFWEGIDLPGDQLTTLAIVRLPFAPPTHPVAQARAERIERSGQSAFWQVSLPEAVVRFRQGFGRLIRTIDDRGVVVVYDKRIITARYGQVFLRSLPNVRPVVAREAEVVEQVGRFLRAESGTAAAQR
jgi:ATP-dependent DNA helicase DinG